MLVLTRKVGEEIVIGDNIRITVVEVGPGRVKIGIAAPKDVRIDRDEIRAKKDTVMAEVRTREGTEERTREGTEERTHEGIQVPTILHNRISAHIEPAPAPASTPLPTGVSTGPRTAAIHNRLKAYRPRPAKI